ncbi:uncharacterized protein LOC124271104 [Haliotis rubra]|uniref:uncharacterized protein LOC124271104 n=1 Tax=Haliotis rubra TaxID=36100 RepID=UPI001EE5B6B5|nr:uncharacterized protein LOC124271104 [Haliotis rubra]
MLLTFTRVASTKKQTQDTMTWLVTTVLFFSITGRLTDAECHCNTTTACDVFPSTPCSQVGDPDRCQEGWFGSYCQKRNIALGRSATQSSTYSENNYQTGNTTHRFEAWYAVDGRTTTVVYSKPLTCSVAGSQYSWTVYLNNSKTDKIQHVKLYLDQRFLGKVFTKTLNNGLSNWCDSEDKLYEDEAGYRKGHRTMDNMFVLQSLVTNTALLLSMHRFLKGI